MVFLNTILKSIFRHNECIFCCVVYLDLLFGDNMSKYEEEVPESQETQEKNELQETTPNQE